MWLLKTGTDDDTSRLNYEKVNIILGAIHFRHPLAGGEFIDFKMFWGVGERIPLVYDVTTQK